MLSKGKVVYGYSLRRRTLTSIILCAVVWWSSATGMSRTLRPVFWPDALAQDTAPTGLRVDAQSTSWSPERPRSNKVPYLVIGMTKRWDTRPYGSFGIAPDDGTNPSKGNTIMRQVGPGASVDRAEKTESGPLLLSSVLDPTAGVRGLANFREEPTSPRQTSQISPDLAGDEVYSLLDDGSAPGSFLFGYQVNYFPSNQWIAENESFTHAIVLAPRPFLQLEFGAWHLPVALSKAALSQ
jgi:hypothetical protein